MRDEIRPFVRASRPTVTRAASRRCATSPPPRPTSSARFKVVNHLLDTLAYNPPGKEEGYLFWVAWANHLGNQLFTTQDAHGPIRRGLFITTCQDVPVLDQVAAVQPAARHADRAAQPAEAELPATRPKTRSAAEGSLDAEGRPLLRSHRRHGRLRAVLLRPAAVPVARVRRHDPAEAEGLPLHGLVHRGDAARPGGRRAHLRRAGRQGQDDRARQGDGPLRRRDPARLALRAAALGREGDPAPEDAAGRDLRRADARARRRPRRCPRAGSCATAQVSPTVELDEIFRSFDPQHAARVPDVDADAGAGDQGPRARHQRRARQPRPVRRGRRRGGRHPQPPGGGGAAAGLATPAWCSAR